MEEGLILDQDASLINYHSNLLSNLIVREYTYNDLDCFIILIEHVSDVKPPFEKEIVNLNDQISSQEILDSCHKFSHESFDFSSIQEEKINDHKMFDFSSPKHNEPNESSEEVSIHNVFSHNCGTAREPFHFIVFNSFFNSYPTLFTNLGAPYYSSILYCTEP